MLRVGGFKTKKEQATLLRKCCCHVTCEVTAPRSRLRYCTPVIVLATSLSTFLRLSWRRHLADPLHAKCCSPTPQFNVSRTFQNKIPSSRSNNLAGFKTVLIWEPLASSQIHISGFCKQPALKQHDQVFHKDKEAKNNCMSCYMLVCMLLKP